MPLRAGDGKPEKDALHKASASSHPSFLLRLVPFVRCLFLAVSLAWGRREVKNTQTGRPVKRQFLKSRNYKMPSLLFSNAMARLLQYTRRKPEATV